MEVDDLASNCESVSKSKLSFEKTLRSCEDQLAEAQRKIEEQDRMIAELNTEKDWIKRILLTERLLGHRRKKGVTLNRPCPSSFIFIPKYPHKGQILVRKCRTQPKYRRTRLAHHSGRFSNLLKSRHLIGQFLHPDLIGSFSSLVRKIPYNSSLMKSEEIVKKNQKPKTPLLTVFRLRNMILNF